MTLGELGGCPSCARQFALSRRRGQESPHRFSELHRREDVQYSKERLRSAAVLLFRCRDAAGLPVCFRDAELARFIQQLDDFLIAGLIKIHVVKANRVERSRRRQTDTLVGLGR
jgi:hypothetical protein